MYIIDEMDIQKSAQHKGRYNQGILRACNSTQDTATIPAPSLHIRIDLNILFRIFESKI